MRLLNKYENFSAGETTLMQQLTALNQEMDQLKLQLNKVNQLLNDTISEKCKQELIYTQQQQQNSTQNYMQMKAQNFNSKSDNGNLFRASLVPIGATNPNIGDSTSVSSIWKTSNSPGKQQKLNNGVQFSSIDNLADDYSSSNKYKGNNYAQLETPRVKQQYRSSAYNPNHHYYYLNTEMQNSIKKNKLDHNFSKSIDALYSGANQKFMNESSNTGAFNYTQPKKTSLVDNCKDDYRELPVTFQPVNFTQSRPTHNGTNQQAPPSQPKVVRDGYFKRDSVAEKKRASIGKFPQNLNVRLTSYTKQLFLISY